jgi:hypothetical protein
MKCGTESDKCTYTFYMKLSAYVKKVTNVAIKEICEKSRRQGV